MSLARRRSSQFCGGGRRRSEVTFPDNNGTIATLSSKPSSPTAQQQQQQHAFSGVEMPMLDEADSRTASFRHAVRRGSESFAFPTEELAQQGGALLNARRRSLRLLSTSSSTLSAGGGDSPARHRRRTAVALGLRIVVLSVILLLRIQRAVERMRRQKKAIGLHTSSSVASNNSGSNTPHAMLSARRSTTTPRKGLAFPINEPMKGDERRLSAADPLLATNAFKADVSVNSSSSHRTTSPVVAIEPLLPPCVVEVNEAELDQISVASADSLDRVDDDPEDPNDKNAVRTNKFFPTAEDLEEFPPAIQRTILQDVMKVFRRFVTAWRFRKVLKQRLGGRTKAAVSSIPAPVVEHSALLQGWSPVMLEELFSLGATTRLYGPGTFISFPNEPPRWVHVVTSGTVAEVQPGVNVATSSLRKRASPYTVTSQTIGTYTVTTGQFFREQIPLIENLSELPRGVYSVSTCTVVSITVDAINEVFRKYGVESNAISPSVVQRYRSLRESAIAVYLSQTESLLHRLAMNAAAANTAAAAAAVLSEMGEGSHPAAAPPQSGGICTTPTLNTSREVAAIASESSPSPPQENGAHPTGPLDATPSHAHPLPHHSAKPSTSTVGAPYVIDLTASSLLHHVTTAQQRQLLRKLIPKSYFAGEMVHEKDSTEDFRNMYFVLRGTLAAVSVYREAASESQRDKNGNWSTMTFARWKASEAVGDKALYFQEPPVFSLQAESNCDVAVLSRAALMRLMEADRSMKQQIAQGALTVRAGDPAVRLRLQSVRDIPCVASALDDGIISEQFVRELHRMFSIQVFPAKELITSTSEAVRHMIVISNGAAIADVSGPSPFAVEKGLALGSALLLQTRWRYAVYAKTECEGWILSVNDFAAICRKHGIFHEMIQRTKAEYLRMRRTAETCLGSTSLFELPTPQETFSKKSVTPGKEAPAKAQLPTRHLLEQRSFLQQPPPGLPMVPLSTKEASTSSAGGHETTSKSMTGATKPSSSSTKTHSSRHNESSPPLIALSVSTTIEIDPPPSVVQQPYNALSSANPLSNSLRPDRGGSHHPHEQLLNSSFHSLAAPDTARHWGNVSSSTAHQGRSISLAPLDSARSVSAEFVVGPLEAVRREEGEPNDCDANDLEEDHRGAAGSVPPRMSRRKELLYRFMGAILAEHNDSCTMKSRPVSRNRTAAPPPLRSTSRSASQQGTMAWCGSSPYTIQSLRSAIKPQNHQ